jgi:lipopolysaccharide transport system permease protein
MPLPVLTSSTSLEDGPGRGPATPDSRDLRIDPAAVQAVVTVLEPSRGWQFINIGELWQFRELVFFLIWRDVKVRYKQTVLGAAWAVLQPAMLLVVFTLFFKRVTGEAAGAVPYPLFIYAGLLPWTFFAAAVAAAGQSVVGSERLITKTYFPRLGVPFAAVGAAVVDLAIASGLLVALMLAYGVIPGVGVLLLPAVCGLIILTALGVGTLLAALNVVYRDFRYVLPFLIQVWMFATPTVYIPPGSRPGPNPAHDLLLSANPLNGLIGAFRAASLGLPITWAPLSVAAFGAVSCFVGGCLYFRKVEDRFCDMI